MERYNGMEDYGTWSDGSSIFKDKKGYYIIQWDPKAQAEYKKYIPKSWKPSPSRTRLILRCKGQGKTKKCKWTRVETALTKTKSKTRKNRKN